MKTKPQTPFWYGHAEIPGNPRRHVTLAVAAFTERSALRQIRLRVGANAVKLHAEPVKYAHAWVIDMVWPS